MLPAVHLLVQPRFGVGLALRLSDELDERVFASAVDSIEKFRARMVEKLAGPNAMSGVQLAAEYSWRE
jgi:hypothetical protein